MAGLESFTSPYLAPTTTGNVLLKGVNYASSAAGIFNDTNLDNSPIPFDEQISNFAKTRRDIQNFGIRFATKFLRKAIFVVAIGANDLLIWERSLKLKNSITRSAYIDIILSRFRSQLTRLYELDARKILVTNCGVAGCLPYERDTHPSEAGCVPSVNQLAKAYNRKLKILLEELTRNLEGSQYIYVDSYSMSEDIIRNYKAYGFENRDFACCHVVGLHGGLLACGALSPVCQNRSKYVFWDPYHLTDRANMIVAKYMMDGGQNYMYPINLRQLLNS